MALAEAGQPEGFGFIDPGQSVSAVPTYRVHDLWHHAPDYVAKRRKREMERTTREAPDQPVRRTAPNGEHWQGTPGDQTGLDRTPSPSPSPSPTEQSGSAAPTPGAPPASLERFVCGAQAPQSPTLLTFPTVGTGGSAWALTEAQVATWQALYPGTPILAAAQKALAWIEANPGRRKTASGMPRFLVNWLNREVDRGRTTTPAATSMKRLGPNDPEYYERARRAREEAS